MGSDSDLPVMEEAARILDQFEVSFTMKILSAHRTPDLLESFIKMAELAGVKVFICGAGAAAHLAGAVASRTVRPVLGIPLEGSPFKGVDALLATVQMPGGVPVATFGVGKSGAVNAGLLAVQIVSLDRPELQKKMHDYRQQQHVKIGHKNTELQKRSLATYKMIVFAD